MRKFRVAPGHKVTASTLGDYEYEAYVCFDFVNDGNYNEYRIQDVVSDIVSECGGQLVGIDFQAVDYSDYPEYAGEAVSQCMVDIECNSNFDREKLEYYLPDRIEALGYEVAGIDFGSR